MRKSTRGGVSRADRLWFEHINARKWNPLRDGARGRHTSNNFDSAACRPIHEFPAGEQQGSVCSDRMTVSSGHTLQRAQGNRRKDQSSKDRNGSQNYTVGQELVRRPRDLEHTSRG